MTHSDQSLEPEDGQLQALLAAARKSQQQAVVNTILLSVAIFLLIVVLVVTLVTYHDLGGFLHDMRSAFLER